MPKRVASSSMPTKDMEIKRRKLIEKEKNKKKGKGSCCCNMS